MKENLTNSKKKKEGMHIQFVSIWRKTTFHLLLLPNFPSPNSLLEE